MTIYKKIFLAFLFISFFQHASGQTTTKDSVDQFFNKVKGRYNCDISSRKKFKVISEGALRTMIRRDFSFLVLNRDQSSSGAGTGFTMDFNNDKTVATYNIAFLNGSEKKSEKKLKEVPRASWIFSASVQAGYSNSIGTVFSNSKANGKAGVTLKFSKLISRWSAPSATELICNNATEVSKVYVDYLVTQSDVERLTYENLLVLIKQQEDSISSIEAKIKVTNKPDDLLKLYEQKKKFSEALVSLKKSKVKGTPYAVPLIRKGYDSLMAYELRDVKWSKQKVSWIDFQYSANVGSYNIFDDVASLTNLDTTLKQSYAGVAFNQIMNWKNYLFFWKVGYRNSMSNNLEGATSYTLDDSHLYDNGDNQKKIGNSISAFKLSETGAFETYRQHVLEGDAVFMFAKNRLGFHGFLDLGFNYDTDLYTKTGVLNGGLGMIFTVFDQAKEKAKVNIEPFFKLKDINAQTKVSEKYDTWERYTFGIKLGLPFNRVLL